MALQRHALEASRARIFRELESRSAELAAANLALNDALQTRDVFLNAVSHELKTPLTCVIAYSEFLAEEGLDREDAREHARTVLREARSLQRLIEQVFEVTRIRSGLLRLERAGVDLCQLVRGAAERERPGAEALEVTLSFSPTGESLPAWADARRLDDAVGSLLRNAIRHSRSSGWVDVRTRRLDDGWGEIEVRYETGRSAQTERDALDQPFAGLDPSPRGRAGDLGLGIPLVKRFVMAHGGVVQVSKVRGGVLRHRIQLPLQPSAPRDRRAEALSIDALPLDRAS